MGSDHRLRMLDPQQFLLELKSRGATRISRVTFRNNRTILWSLTQNGKVLNLHIAYRSASSELLDAFSTLAREGGVCSPASRRAAATVHDWPPLADALHEARASHSARATAGGCATPGQRRYLRALFRYFNRTRFAGCLPPEVPVRLSNRMTSRLGHMLPDVDEAGRRSVREIALNVDLMLEGNGVERIDTLLHEMAHVADYLDTGHRGHGASWRAWALRVGCRPWRLYDRTVVTRSRRRDAVIRVPPLPPAVLRLGR